MSDSPGGLRVRAAAEWLLIAVLLGAVAWIGHALADLRVLGLIRDDGEFVAYAQALLAGLGFVDPADPGRAAAARYPIGLPALIAAVISGAADWPTQLARLAWLTPLALAAYVGLAHLYFRRAAGLGAGWALGLSLLVALNADLVVMAAVVNSDLPFAALALAAVVALERPLRAGAGPARWAAGGALVAAACLVRTTGLALVAGLALAAWRHGRLRASWPAFAPVALALGGWSLYRASLGGQSYGDVFRATLPADPGAWGTAIATVVGKLLGKAVPELLAPWLLEGADAMQLAVGVVVSLLVIGGLVAWLVAAGPAREAGAGGTAPGAGEAPASAAPPASALGPAYALATMALALAWSVSFYKIEPNIVTRVMLPVAPFLPLALAAGVRAALGPTALPAWAAPRRLAAVALAVAVLGGLAGLRHPLAAIAEAPLHRQQVAAWEEFFQAVRTHARPGDLVASKYHVVVWLHAGRRGYTIPSYFVANEHVALPPLEALRFLSEKPVSWVAAVPSVPGEPNTTAGTLNPILRERPGVLEAVWVNARGDFALFEVQPEALAATCAALGLPAPVPRP